MGKYFDSLVEILKKGALNGEESMRFDKGFNVRSYLEKVVTRSALFDFPLNSEEIFPKTGKDVIEYNRYLADYFSMSKQYNKNLIMPFKITTIEDKMSAVSLENVENNQYMLVYSIGSPLEKDGKSIEESNVVCSKLKILDVYDDSGNIPLLIEDFCSIHMLDGVKLSANMHPMIGEDYSRRLNEDIVKSAVAYIEQLVYIMDPANFIIREESNQSKAIGRKMNPKKQNSFFRKTVIRPHYVCLNESETKDFLSDQSKEPRPFHPVRGHWRNFISDRYIHKKGQKIFIEQFFRGKSQIAGKNGWNYNVLVKESPIDLVSYNSDCVSSESTK